MRRKYLGGNTQTNYDTITEEGVVLKTPEETKEHIANYFENLYQAREGKPQYDEWTRKIKEKNQTIIKELEKKPPAEEIRKEELDKIIKNLKRNKATGPDDIPNEIFKEADEGTREIYRDAMNKIAKEKEIPEQWQKGDIKRLYKGKGVKGKCSNERGITMSSNFGKVFERIINERAKEKIKMTELQAGGSKGRATVDHILILKEVITYLKNKRKSVYVVFLDVTKAYDKAWLDAIMYVMYKQGLQDNTWCLMRKLNENLTARIDTKYGKTRQIEITDSIRQGGVLSVIQYALLMDEISKEIDKKNLGVELGENTIGSLLWMDDVLLISSDTDKMKEMLETTDHISSIYHIEFGQAKSNIMKVGKKGMETPMQLGQMDIEYVSKYKYLGLIQNNRNNLADQIACIRGKVEAAYQTIMAIAEDNILSNMEMQTIWENVEICIIATITYSGEVWKPTKTEMKEINRILDGILKRILMVPPSTPREVLYIETGIMDPETIIKRNRILMQNRIRKGDSELMKQVIELEQKGGWKETTEKIKEEMGIEQNDMRGEQSSVKHRIRRKTKQYFKEKMEREGNGKSKVTYLLEGLGHSWKPGKRQQYLNALPRKQASILFKSRTRMLDVKNNFRGKYQNTQCRMCRDSIETQEHVLEECKQLHPTEDTKVRKPDIFSENTESDINREIARKIEYIMEILENTDV